MLIGAPGASGDGVDVTGAAYVVWGGHSLPGLIKLGSLTTDLGVTFYGAANGDQFGFVVSYFRIAK